MMLKMAYFTNLFNIFPYNFQSISGIQNLMVSLDRMQLVNYFPHLRENHIYTLISIMMVEKVLKLEGLDSLHRLID